MEKEILDIKAKNSREISMFSRALSIARREKDEMVKRALQSERKVEQVEAENKKLAKAFDEKMISMNRQKESAEEELLYISTGCMELEERNRELEERNRKLEKKKQRVRKQYGENLEGSTYGE